MPSVLPLFPLTALFLFLWPSLSAAQSASPAPPPASSDRPPLADFPLLRQFEERYRKANRLQVTFLERYSENDSTVRIESGNAYFLHPGKMRWDYQAPEKNMFLVDGKYVWFYSPADHTATRMPVKRSEDWRTPLAFLTSHMKLSRLCSNVEQARGEKPAQSPDSVYRCALREPSQPASSKSRFVLFELSPEGALNRLVIPQEGGVTLEFSFTGWRWDPVLDAGVFQFVPPRDTVIVEGLLPDTPGLRQ